MSGHKNQVQALFEIWEVLLRFRWRFILPMFATMVVILALSLFLPRKYKAKAIFERRTDLVMMEMMHRGAPPSMPNIKKAIVEEVAGQPAVDELVEKLNESPWGIQRGVMDSHRLEELRLALSRKIIVHHDIATNQRDRVTVEFVDEDRALARSVVNTLVQNYINRTRAQIEKRLRQTASFFETEVHRSRESIEELENRQLTFEIENAELLPDKPGSIQAMLVESQLQLINLKQQQDATSMRVETLQKQIKEIPPTIPSVTTARNPELLRLEARLRELSEKKDQFVGLLKMTGRHPELQTLEDQILAVKQEISQTPAEVVLQKQMGTNAKREAMEIQLTEATTQLLALEKQELSLKQQIVQLNDETADLFPIRSNYRKLTRDTEEAQRQLAFWEDNLRRVRMALTAEAGNRGVQLDFIKPSNTLHKPISPNLAQVLVAALVTGVLAGSINVLVAQRTDESFSEGDRLAEAFNLTLLGSVSEIISRRQRHIRRLQNLVLYPLNAAVMVAVLLVMVGLLYLNLESPMRFEQFKQNPTNFIEQQLDRVAPISPAVSKE